MKIVKIIKPLMKKLIEQKHRNKLTHYSKLIFF